VVWREGQSSLPCTSQPGKLACDGLRFHLTMTLCRNTRDDSTRRENQSSTTVRYTKPFVIGIIGDVHRPDLVRQHDFHAAQQIRIDLVPHRIAERDPFRIAIALAWPYADAGTAPRFSSAASAS